MLITRVTLVTFTLIPRPGRLNLPIRLTPPNLGSYPRVTQKAPALPMIVAGSMRRECGMTKRLRRLWPSATTLSDPARFVEKVPGVHGDQRTHRTTRD